MLFGAAGRAVGARSLSESCAVGVDSTGNKAAKRCQVMTLSAFECNNVKAHTYIDKQGFEM